jgi:hypothetical protein
MWRLHLSERTYLDRIYGYVIGQVGSPHVPENAEDEIKDLARLSIKNVLGLVRDAFTQNLAVIGYRSSLAKENAPAWQMWQRNCMDARQAEVHRPAVTYGAAYVVVTEGEDGSVWRARSPRQLLAVYEDPQVDRWPQYAFEQWVDNTDAHPRWKGILYDDQYIYPVDLGAIPTLGSSQYETALAASQYQTLMARSLNITDIGDPMPHAASHCPVVRFINGRDADQLIVGEIEPLIRLQQTLNSVNFDRLIASRFGAHPQKVIAGWSGTSSEVLQASARRVWAFEDPDVKVSSFQPASLEQYNGVIHEITEHIAMVAQISPGAIQGKMVNLSAEALAAAEANQQRKLTHKRDSFGESWEQVFRLAAEIEGDTATAEDTSSEVQWRDTEARSFGAIVDGITKLSAAGIPIEELIDLVPGVNQQKSQSIKDALRRGQTNQLIAALQATPAPPAPTAAATPTPAAPVIEQMPKASPKPSPANMPMSNGAVNR